MTHRDRVGGSSGRRKVAGDAVHRQNFSTPPDGPHTRSERRLATVSRFCGISVGRLPESGDWRVSKNTEKISRHVKWRTYITDLSSKPISSDSVDNYKSVLTPAECATVDDRCQSIRNTFDYP